MFCLVFLLILFVSSAIGSAQNEIVEDNQFQHCVCVPYWQCKDDYSGLIEDGADIMDIRKLRSATSSSEAQCTGDFDVCCRVECGKRRRISNENQYQNRFYPYLSNDIYGFRILGENNEASFGEFPWMVGVLRDRTYRCGASLIHPKVALTAAHCVRGPGPYRTRAGEHNWETLDEPLPHQDRLVQKVIIHPAYHPGSLRNDIALLIMVEPFKLTENVGVACIPPRNARYDFERCTATGWGKNSFQKGTYQSTLKKIDLPIVPRDKCTYVLQQARLGPLFSLHRSFICAGGELNKDTCKGDGGSPLVCPIVGQPDRYEQIGIVSWGLTCGVASTPGVYVNVALYGDWIDTQMRRHDFDTNVYRY